MGKGQKSQQQPPSSWRSWIRSYPTVQKWASKYDINKLLDEGGGICRIPNFLPEHVADGILSVLEQIPEKDWHITAARQDYTNNNINHEFWSTKSSKGLDEVLRLFSILIPDQCSTFSAARYDKSHHIAPHDDRAYTEVAMEDGNVVTCSRDVAIIYYLTRDWQAALGGVLLDLEGGQAYVPQYNSAVAFRVPRYHEVTPLTTDRARYSIFGWFLQPGLLYDLYTGEEQQQQQQQEQQQEEEEEEQGAHHDVQQQLGHGSTQSQQQQQRTRHGSDDSHHQQNQLHDGSTSRKRHKSQPAAKAAAAATKAVAVATKAAAAGSKHKGKQHKAAAAAAAAAAAVAAASDHGGSPVVCKLKQRLLAKLCRRERKQQLQQARADG